MSAVCLIEREINRARQRAREYFYTVRRILIDPLVSENNQGPQASKTACAPTGYLATKATYIRLGIEMWLPECYVCDTS